MIKLSDDFSISGDITKIGENDIPAFIKELANGNISWNAAGEVSTTGRFETSANGRRVVIDNANANLGLSNG